MGVCWVGALSGGGGRRRRWELDVKGLKGGGEDFMLSPVGAGRKIFKSGQENNQICVFIRSKEVVGTGHKLMHLAGKGVIKGQSECCGLWDLGRGRDNHPFFQRIFTEVRLCARRRLDAGAALGIRPVSLLVR